MAIEPSGSGEAIDDSLLADGTDPARRRTLAVIVQGQGQRGLADCAASPLTRQLAGSNGTIARNYVEAGSFLREFLQEQISIDGERNGLERIAGEISNTQRVRKSFLNHGTLSK